MSATAPLHHLLSQTAWGAAKHLGLPSTARPLGVASLDAALPDGGLPRGQVIEVAISAGLGFATTLGLLACRAAQEEAQLSGADAWCAFVDPSGSLFAPALQEARVDPQRLLVVRPELGHDRTGPGKTSKRNNPSWGTAQLDEDSATISRIAVKLAEARLFSVLVIDMAGLAWCSRPAQNASPFRPPSLSQWGKTVRRLSLAVSGTATQVILLTDRSARRSLPLPVGLRLELQRRSRDQLLLTVAKEKHGRVQSPRLVSMAPNSASPLARAQNQRHLLSAKPAAVDELHTLAAMGGASKRAVNDSSTHSASSRSTSPHLGSHLSVVTN